MFKKFIIFCLTFALSLNTTLIVYADSLPEVFEPKCEEFKTHFNLEKIPNLPLSHYLQNVNDEDQKQNIIHNFKADQFCIQLEDKKNDLKYITDQEKKEKISLEIKTLEESLQTEREFLQKLQEKKDFLDKIDGIISFRSKFGFEEGLVFLIKKRDAVLQDIEKVLVWYNEEEEKFWDENLTDLEKEVEKFKNYELDKFETEKNNLKEKLLQTFIPLKEDVYEVKNKYKQKIQNNLETSFAQDREFFLQSVQTEYTDLKEREEAIKAFDKTVTEHKEIYQKQIDEIFSVIDLKYEIFIEEIEKVLGEGGDLSSLNQIVNKFLVGLNSKEILEKMDFKAVEKVELSIESLLTETDPLVMGFISLMTTTEFNLLKLLEYDNSRSEYAENKVLVDFLTALKNDNFTEVKKLLGKEKDIVKLKLEVAINAQKEGIKRAYQDRINKLKLTGEDSLIELYPENIKTETVLNKEDLEKLEKTDFSEDLKTALLEIANIYGGYLDYLISYFKNYPSSSMRLKVLKSYKAKALKGAKMLEEKILGQNLSKNSERFLYFSLLSNLEKYVKTKLSLKDGEKQITYKFNPLFLDKKTVTGMYFLKQSIGNVLKEEKELEKIKQELTEEFLTLFKNKDSFEDEWNKKMVKTISVLIADQSLNFSQIEDNKEVFLSENIKKELKRRAKRQLRNFKNSHLKSLLKKADDQGYQMNSYNTVNTSTHNYYFNIYTNVMIGERKRGNNKGIDELVFYNKQNQVISKIQKQMEGLVYLYRYDEEGRIKTEILAQAKELWNKDKKRFDFPKYWNKKDDKDNFVIVRQRKFYYFDNSKDIKKIEYSSPLTTVSPDKPSKVLEKISLYEDFKSPLSKLSTFYARFITNLKITWDTEKDKKILKRKIGRVVVSNSEKKVGEVKIYYDNDLIPVFLEDNNKGEVVFLKYADKNHYLDAYPDKITQKGVLNKENNLELTDYISNDGKIIGYKKENSSALKDSLISSKDYVAGLFSTDINNKNNNNFYYNEEIRMSQSNKKEKNIYNNLLDIIHNNNNSKDELVENIIRNTLVYSWPDFLKSYAKIWLENGGEAEDLNDFLDIEKYNIFFNKQVYKNNSDELTASIKKFIKIIKDPSKNISTEEIGVPITPKIEVKETIQFDPKIRTAWRFSHGFYLESSSEYSYFLKKREIDKLLQDYVKNSANGLFADYEERKYLKNLSGWWNYLEFLPISSTFVFKIPDSIRSLYFSPLKKEFFLTVKPNNWEEENINVRYLNKIVNRNNLKFNDYQNVCYQSENFSCMESYLGQIVSPLKTIKDVFGKSAYVSEYENGYLLYYIDNEYLNFIASMLYKDLTYILLKDMFPSDLSVEKIIKEYGYPLQDPHYIKRNLKVNSEFVQTKEHAEYLANKNKEVFNVSQINYQEFFSGFKTYHNSNGYMLNYNPSSNNQTFQKLCERGSLDNIHPDYLSSKGAFLLGAQDSLADEAMSVPFALILANPVILTIFVSLGALYVPYKIKKENYAFNDFYTDISNTYNDVSFKGFLQKVNTKNTSCKNTESYLKAYVVITAIASIVPIEKITSLVKVNPLKFAKNLKKEIVLSNFFASFKDIFRRTVLETKTVFSKNYFKQYKKLIGEISEEQFDLLTHILKNPKNLEGVKGKSQTIFKAFKEGTLETVDDFNKQFNKNLNEPYIYKRVEKQLSKVADPLILKLKDSFSKSFSFFKRYNLFCGKKGGISYNSDYVASASNLLVLEKSDFSGCEIITDTITDTINKNTFKKELEDFLSKNKENIEKTLQEKPEKDFDMNISGVDDKVVNLIKNVNWSLFDSLKDNLEFKKKLVFLKLNEAVGRKLEKKDNVLYKVIKDTDLNLSEYNFLNKIKFKRDNLNNKVYEILNKDSNINVVDLFKKTNSADEALEILKNKFKFYDNFSLNLNLNRLKKAGKTKLFLRSLYNMKEVKEEEINNLANLLLNKGLGDFMEKIYNGFFSKNLKKLNITDIKKNWFLDDLNYKYLKNFTVEEKVVLFKVLKSLGLFDEKVYNKLITLPLNKKKNIVDNILLTKNIDINLQNLENLNNFADYKIDFSKLLVKKNFAGKKIDWDKILNFKFSSPIMENVQASEILTVIAHSFDDLDTFTLVDAGFKEDFYGRNLKTPYIKDNFLNLLATNPQSFLEKGFSSLKYIIKNRGKKFAPTKYNIAKNEEKGGWRVYKNPLSAITYMNYEDFKLYKTRLFDKGLHWDYIKKFNKFFYNRIPDLLDEVYTKLTLKYYNIPKEKQEEFVNALIAYVKSKHKELSSISNATMNLNSDLSFKQVKMFDLQTWQGDSSMFPNMSNIGSEKIINKKALINSNKKIMVVPGPKEGIMGKKVEDIVIRFREKPNGEWEIDQVFTMNFRKEVKKINSPSKSSFTFNPTFLKDIFIKNPNSEITPKKELHYKNLGLEIRSPQGIKLNPYFKNHKILFNNKEVLGILPYRSLKKDNSNLENVYISQEISENNYFYHF
jgi:phospholipid N-methyltransferase